MVGAAAIGDLRVARVAHPVAEWLRKPTVTPVAMSRFGQEQMAAAGIDSHYVPHAIDTDVFKRTESIQTAGGDMTGREIIGVEPGIASGNEE